MKPRTHSKIQGASRRAWLPYLVLACTLLLTIVAAYYVVQHDGGASSGAWLASFILSGGIFFGLVLFFVTHSQVRARGAAEAAAEIVAASETRYRTMVEQSPLSTQIFSPGGRTLRVNRAWEKLWGVTLEQLGDYNILEDQQLVEKGIAPFIRRGFEGEASAVPPILYDPNATLPGITANAEPLRWVQAFIYPVKDEGGRIREVVLVHEDITERRRAEDELHESEQRFRTLIEATFDGIVIHMEGRVIEANKGFATMFGYEPDEIADKLILELVTEECREEVARKISTGDERPYEVTGVRKDGAHFNLEVTGKAHVFKGRRVRVSALRDITERKRAERTLNLHSRVLENMTEGVSLSDEQGFILYTNPAEDEMFGYERGELNGQHVTVQNTYPPEENARIVGDVIERLKADGVWFGEFSNRRQDGTPFTTFARITALEMLGRQHWVCVQEDITERKRFEDELRTRADELAEANRLKDEFLATLSHELRTPLTSVLGWAKLLRTEKLSPDVVSRALETIERNATMQAQLINDLLDVSRIITGKLRLEVGAVNLGPVIEEAADSVRLAAEARGVNLNVRLDPGVGAIAGDADRLRQVVWNLLTNAIKFTPAGGHVDVGLERSGAHVRVVVKDTGAGIGTEFLPHVFDRFRQADGAITREHGGLGLGLSIARHLVELHGGTVRAESEGEGRGSTFIINLPPIPLHTEANGAAGVSLPEGVHTEAAAAAAGEQHTGILDGLHVLVVDDDEDSCVLLSMVLRRSGACVSTATSAAEALDAFRLEPPDVLVSDIGMPGEDGYSLVGKVRALDAARGARTPAAALTAYARPDDEARTLAAGYDVHIPKPIEPPTLVATVAALAGRKADA